MPDSRDVFRLRKEGRYADALALARKLYPDSPQDEWLIRAYGWTLHECLKAAQGPGSAWNIHSLMDEFNGLPIPEEELLLVEKRKQWLTRMPAANGAPTLFELLQQAKASSSDGDHSKALLTYRKALKLYPKAPDAALALGWELQRSLKDLIAKDPPDATSIRLTLNEYRQLPTHERPGKLHSLMLFRAAQAGERKAFPDFIDFFRWWDPVNLRKEDFSGFRPPDQDHDFPSCVEHVIKAIYKTATKDTSKAALAWVTTFVEANYERFPDQEWFPYYYGKLLILAGDRSHARAAILPIVRRKRTEFWAWDCLGSTFDDTDAPLRLACLCRSASCVVKEPSFLVNVHEELGCLLVASGLHTEARFELDCAMQIRREKKWTVPERLRQFERASWWQAAGGLSSNQQLYAEHAPRADDIILEGLPVLEAVLAGSMPKTEDKPAISFIAYSNGMGLGETRVKTKRYPLLRDLPQGTALSAKLDASTEPPQIVWLQVRDAPKWDIYPDKMGIVSQINQPKKLSVIALNQDEVVIAHHDQFPYVITLAPGRLIALKVRHDDKHNCWRILDIRPAKTDSLPPFCQESEGVYEKREDQPFGFVKPDIFCPPDLVQSSHIPTGARVTCLAIREMNKKKNCYGWRALTLRAL